MNELTLEWRLYFSMASTMGLQYEIGVGIVSIHIFTL